MTEIPANPSIDAAERATALDPAHSFIVQAPAGSGKTELLTQRYLRLLALVDYPEEIAAITFTRKAAAEMRNRVLAALDSAGAAQPAEPHKRTTWKLACAVATRDAEQHWQLRDNPNRLRIQTFDSLAGELTRQMPMLTEIGAPPGIREDAEPLYRQAARATLGGLDDAELGPHLARLLRHLDNRLGQLEDLLCGMLARRDQWLPHVLSAPDVDQLEAALRAEIEQRLQRLKDSFPPLMLGELVRLAGWAADNQPQDKRAKSALPHWLDHSGIPDTRWEELPLWLGLCELVMTKTGGRRSRLDKNIGFPPPGEKGLDPDIKAARQLAKDEMTDLLGQLDQHPPLLDGLAGIPHLPWQGYSEDQGQVLHSLMQCLLHAAAELALTFSETGEVDYAEQGQRALLALGSEEHPTDLALALDYRLKHLLVDEFQDTSSSQHRLLRLLTAGWQAGDGRSLLLVGDPMQSIYRFREAEVGLYLRTREAGLGELALQPLTLRMNFRSQAGVVEWVNQAFAQLFPAQGDAARGAVPYAPSNPAHAAQPHDAVQIHPSLQRDDVTEANAVTDLIASTLAQWPQHNIAVLARGRAHLATIAGALQAQGIGFVAVDVDPLEARSLVQDLRSLTRALLHPADRLAWLSLLRAPWLGLAISDLLRIAEHSQLALPRRLQDPALLDTLSVDGKARVERLLQVLGNELPARGRLPLRSWIEGIWLALGGAALAGPAGRADAKACLDLIEKLEQPGGRLDLAEFDRQLARLYAAPDSRADGRVQIMTMHAAKGLEFDTVILPGLGRKMRGNSSELLSWAELPEPDGSLRLLMAPIRARLASAEPIADFIRRLNEEKDRLETVRLLYVAATRARQRLHLFGHAAPNSKDQPSPTANSLLATLWPVVGADYEDLGVQSPGVQTLPPPAVAEPRLAADWKLQLPDAVPVQPLAPPGRNTDAQPIDFDWAGDTARHVGTLVHRYLERIARQGIEHWSAERIDCLGPQLAAALAHLGVEPEQTERAVDKTQRALRNTLEDERGCWILHAHSEHACELPLTHLEQIGGGVGLADSTPGLSARCQHYIIDRTFIDQDDVRWIIDYKTGEHLEQDTEAFLDNEQVRYREQLDNYARLMRAIDPRPIRLALYFPLLRGWRDWRGPE